MYKVTKWNKPFPPNGAMFRSTLTSEGYTVYQWADFPGTIYGVHRHEEDQTHWILSGSLEISVMRQGTHVLEAGDRDFMPAGTLHAASVIGDEPVVYFVGAKIPSAKE